jgi:hypothetical protein
MLMGGFAVPVGVLAMVLGRRRVLLRLVVVAVVVVVRRLEVMMRRGRVVRGGIVMMLAGRVLLFLRHGKVLQNEAHDASGQSARLTSATNFPGAKPKKPTWSNTRTAFDHVGLLIDRPPGAAGLPFT